MGLSSGFSTRREGANCNFMGTQLTQYTVPQGVIATKTSLILPQGMSGEEWANFGQWLKTAQESLTVWNVDWLRYGRTNYEEGFVSATLEQMEFDLKFKENLQLIADVAPEYRHENLTQEHYLVASKRCTDEQDRQVWLTTASIEGLSPRELQASIRAHEVIRIDMDKRTVSMPSPYAVRSEYNAWRKELGDAWEHWTAQDCLDVAEALEGPAKFHAELTKRANELENRNG
jgi:hypothetical protein